MEPVAQPDETAGTGNLPADGSAAMRQLKSGAVSLVDQGLVSAANFMTGVFVGRFCGKEQMGLYMLGMTVLFMSMNFQQSLLNMPYMVFCPRHKGRELKLFSGSVALLQLALALGLALVVLATGFGVGAFPGFEQLRPILWTVSCILVFFLFRDFARQMNFARFRFQASLGMDSLALVAQFAIIGVLLAMGRLSAVNVFFALGLSAGLAGMFWFWRTRRDFVVDGSRLGADLAFVWRFGRWPLLAGVVLILTNQCYPWFLNGYHGAGATGELAAVMGVVNVMNPFIIGVGNYLGPRLMHIMALEGKGAMASFTLKSCLFLAACMALLCLVMFLAGDYFIRLIYGQDYSGLGMLVGLVCVAQAADVVSFPFRGGILALERPEALYKVNMIQLGVIIALALALIPSMGKTGVGLCMVLGNGVALLFRIGIYYKVLGGSERHGNLLRQ